MRETLHRRYEKFAREYAVDLNGARAAIAAGYSRRTAASQASDLLRIPKVSRLIDELLARHAEKADVSAERVLGQLARLAFFDPRKFYNDDGSLKSIMQLDDESASALAGMEVEKLYEHYGAGQAKQVGTITKVKFADRSRALELLGKHLKLFTDKVEVSADNDLVEALSRAWKRVGQAPR